MCNCKFLIDHKITLLPPLVLLTGQMPHGRRQLATPRRRLVSSGGEFCPWPHKQYRSSTSGGLVGPPEALTQEAHTTSWWSVMSSPLESSSGSSESFTEAWEDLHYSKITFIHSFQWGIKTMARQFTSIYSKYIQCLGDAYSILINAQDNATIYTLIQHVST